MVTLLQLEAKECIQSIMHVKCADVTSQVETVTKEMESFTAKIVSGNYCSLCVSPAANQFQVDLLQHWAKFIIQNILYVVNATSHSQMANSMRWTTRHIVNFITNNCLPTAVRNATNQSLEEKSRDVASPGMRNVLFVLPVRIRSVL